MLREEEQDYTSHELRESSVNTPKSSSPSNPFKTKAKLTSRPLPVMPSLSANLKLGLKK